VLFKFRIVIILLTLYAHTHTCFVLEVNFNFSVPLEDSVQSTSQRNRIPCSCLDDVIYRLEAQLSKVTSVRTMRTFRPDLPLCQEASNCSSLHPSDVLATCPDDTQCSTSYGISFQNTDMGRSLQPFGRCGFPFGCTHQ
jgi:hypothetical protein